MKDIQNELLRLNAHGNYRTMKGTTVDGCMIDSGDFSGYNLSSNDYLGLATDTALREEFFGMMDVRKLSMSASSSRLLTGNHSAYGELEALLCSLYQRSGALVCGSGYHVNVGVLPAITDERCLILADKLVHASMIDGIRLSRARTVRFRHNDFEQLERLVEQNARSYRRVVVVTESVFSMDGDVSDLRRLVAIKSRYDNVWLYVDEAHAVGVRGAGGLGVAEEIGALCQIDILVGTFGKALASVGAYVICDAGVKEWLVNSMRSLIFSTALPPINVLWSVFVMERLAAMTDRRTHLDRLSRMLSSAVNGAAAEATHIVPMMVGDSSAAVIEALRLQRAGYFVLPIRPPTVPLGTARLRFSLTASLPVEAIDALALLCSCRLGWRQL